MTEKRLATPIIRGVIVPLLTPLNRDDRVDDNAARLLINALIEQGVHALFPLGTTGEGPLFSSSERTQFAETVIDAAAGRVPVIIHTGAITTEATLALTRHAQRAGASAAAVITPWYFRLSESQLIEYFVRVCDAVPDFPIYLYNNPGVAGNTISVHVVEEVYARCPNLAGLKDSGSSLDTLFSLKASLGEQFNTAIGPDGQICAGLALGLHATVSGNANVVPQLVVALYHAAAQNDFDSARELQALLNQVRAILRDGADLSLFKGVLARRGIPAGQVRAPLTQATSAQIDFCCTALDALGVWDITATRRKETQWQDAG
jgi:4-hydroxy-tetrahydrodipicolinate synthase